LFACSRTQRSGRLRSSRPCLRFVVGSCPAARLVLAATSCFTPTVIDVLHSFALRSHFPSLGVPPWRRYAPVHNTMRELGVFAAAPARERGCHTTLLSPGPQVVTRCTAAVPSTVAAPARCTAAVRSTVAAPARERGRHATLLSPGLLTATCHRAAVRSTVAAPARDRGYHTTLLSPGLRTETPCRPAATVCWRLCTASTIDLACDRHKRMQYFSNTGRKTITIYRGRRTVVVSFVCGLVWCLCRGPETAA